jgi:hypothetical protein
MKVVKPYKFSFKSNKLYMRLIPYLGKYVSQRFFFLSQGSEKRNKYFMSNT